MSKTHFRKVYKSDHLGQADIEEYAENGSNLIFTIKHVRQEIGVSVAGRKGNHNIAYFVENIKPMVLNATNAKIVRGFCNNSPFVEDWQNVRIQLYIDPSVRMKGETVGGVRIMNRQPPAEKPMIQQGTEQWNRAVLAYKRDGNLNNVRKHLNVPVEAEKIIAIEASNG